MITLEKVKKAADLIREIIIMTPLVHSPALSRQFKGEIFLKLENLQKTGSFKIRGAANRILSDINRIGHAGVVAASAGNHAQGVALAAKKAGVPAAIVMPEWASITKQEATRAYGGDVIISGQSLGESLEKAKELAKEEGRILIHPYDDPDVIAGQGTIGLEILGSLNDVDMIIVPVGGGGLISGIAYVVKALKPETKVIGVQSEACPSAYESLKKGRIVTVNSSLSIADGISVKQTGKLNFSIIRKYLDDIVLVRESDIAAAVLMLLERKKILAEGAGAVPLAALMSGAIKVKKGSRTVLLISGGNVDSPLLGRIIRQGLINNGRIIRFSVCLDDVPGALSGLLALVASLKANVLHILHHRSARNVPIYNTIVELEIETRGPAHVKEITGNLKNAGYYIDI
ncbi:MAG: threonine ammonia-lyase [Proteobacteria bacterium]|nr:threonine ammonia-lyase [Pseudomonadota bacterium]MBU1571405.1 threonine ammonia-lyase [Pseudomonadota bacterium]